MVKVDHEASAAYLMAVSQLHDTNDIKSQHDIA